MTLILQFQSSSTGFILTFSLFIWIPPSLSCLGCGTPHQATLPQGYTQLHAWLSFLEDPCLHCFGSGSSHWATPLFRQPPHPRPPICADILLALLGLNVSILISNHSLLWQLFLEDGQVSHSWGSGRALFEEFSEAVLIYLGIRSLPGHRITELENRTSLFLYSIWYLVLDPEWELMLCFNWLYLLDLVDR